MHDCVVVMKDGTKYCGPIWVFRPEEGYLTLAGDNPGPDVKLYFRDMVSAVTEDERVSVGVTADEDEIARARKQGWDGT